MTKAESGNKMWGGRFASGPDAIMEAINASIDFDRKLYAQDIEGSRAHAAMLARQGIITESDAAAIDQGLVTILSEIEAGTFAFSKKLEDIHMNVEARLAELVGPAAGRLHTARLGGIDVDQPHQHHVIPRRHMLQPGLGDAAAADQNGFQYV